MICTKIYYSNTFCNITTLFTKLRKTKQPWRLVRISVDIRTAFCHGEIEPTTFQLGRNTPEGFWLLCSKNTLTYEICFFLHTKSIFQKGRIKHGLFKLIAPLCVIKFWFRLKFNCLIISCFYAFGRKWHDKCLR